MSNSKLHPAIVISTDNVIKPDTDKRLYRALQLQNDLIVVVISDPEADIAAASLDVNIGSLSDPVDIPGLAHFCEHMLFMGTKKYPEENHYSEFVTTHGGYSNAYTSAETTNYHFEISPDKFKDALDIFAQFFIEPLFTESATDRELNAVDSENEKNLQSDDWRLTQLTHSLSKPGHDFSKFGTGNKETLDTTPKEKGINVREALLEFHEKYYSSNLMGLCVLSKESLDDMTEYVCELFSQINNTGIKAPSWPEHPFGPDQLRKIVSVVPVKDVRMMTMTWPVPDLHQWWESRPEYYLNHLIGHEGVGSLLSALKAEGWVNSLWAEGSRVATGFSFFDVVVSLTEDGIDHVDDIILMLYQYIKMIRKIGPLLWIFEEGKSLSDMNFRFKDQGMPISVVSYISSTLHDMYPPEECGSGAFLLKKFEPELITQLSDLLVPERMLVTIVGKKFEGKTVQQEKWYGTEYMIEGIPKSSIERWSNPGVHKDMHLPKTNDFIPHNFEQCPRDPGDTEYPRIIQDSNFGRVWFKQDNEYKLPKICMSVAIQSPAVSSTPLNTNLTWLYLRVFNDAFTEYSYDAELTDLQYSLSCAQYGFLLSISGYSDKLHVLLETIMKNLTTFKADAKRVDIFREEYLREMKNFAMAQPTQQADYHLDLLLEERGWTIEELVESVDEMTVEAMERFIPDMFAGMHLETLIFGNATASEALHLADLVERPLRSSRRSRPLPYSQQTRLEREVQLPDGKPNDIQPSSCVYNYYQLGMADTHHTMLLELLVQIIKDPVFNTLRTQEQLGYIVCVWIRAASGVHGMQVTVQSGKHPDFVDGRIEAFLSTVKDLLEKTTAEEYEAYISGLVTARLAKPKSMKARQDKYWNEIISEQYMFDRDDIETEHVKTITKQQLMNFYQECLAEESNIRHKLSVHIVCKDHRGHCDDVQIKPQPKEAIVVDNHTNFKRGMQLFPLPQPRMELFY